MPNEIEYAMNRVLRAYEGFEAVYEGQSLQYPIVLSSNRYGKDPISQFAFTQLVAQWQARGGSDAAKVALTDNATGIDPWLVAGEPCHPGGSLILYVPAFSVAAVDSEGGAVALIGQYTIIWRWRGADAYNAAGRGFHGYSVDGQVSTQPVSAGGGTDSVTFAGAAQRRQTIVAAIETYSYPQAKADVVVMPGTVATLYGVQYTPGNNIGYTFKPLFPNIDPAAAPVQGVFGQGVLPDTVLTQPVNFHAIETACKGDEFVVLLNFNTSLFNVNAEGSRYSFAANARQISYFFGSDVGELGGSPATPNLGLGVIADVGQRLAR